MTPTLLLVTHGTRDPHGREAAHRLAERVADRIDAPVRSAFADVVAPTVTEVAQTISGPIVVVPAFLATGYHVGTDIPAQLARAGRGDAHITPALGEDTRLLDAAARRLREAGHRPGEAVVLAAAGSSDPAARAEVGRAARRLARRLATPVRVGYITTATPTVGDTVAALRAAGHPRVVVASWLLAPGLFQQRLDDSGADAVARPLCPAPPGGRGGRRPVRRRERGHGLHPGRRAARTAVATGTPRPPSSVAIPPGRRLALLPAGDRATRRSPIRPPHRPERRPEPRDDTPHHRSNTKSDR